jgi:hypothetical protein
MPMLMTARGIVFIEGASETAAPGTLVGPAQAAPPGAPAQPGTQDGSDGQGQGDEGGQDGPAAKSAELTALRKWLTRHPSPSRPFACKALTANDVPDLASDARVLLKAADAAPKALSGTGPAGSGTRSW